MSCLIECSFNSVFSEHLTYVLLVSVVQKVVYKVFVLWCLFTSQEYESCFPFVWYDWAFDFAISLGAFRFEFFSKLNILVIIVLTNVFEVGPTRSCFILLVFFVILYMYVKVQITTLFHLYYFKFKQLYVQDYFVYTQF